MLFIVFPSLQNVVKTFPAPCREKAENGKPCPHFFFLKRILKSLPTSKKLFRQSASHKISSKPTVATI